MASKPVWMLCRHPSGNLRAFSLHPGSCKTRLQRCGIPSPLSAFLILNSACITLHRPTCRLLINYIHACFIYYTYIHTCMLHELPYICPHTQRCNILSWSEGISWCLADSNASIMACRNAACLSWSCVAVSLARYGRQLIWQHVLATCARNHTLHRPACCC